MLIRIKNQLTAEQQQLARLGGVRLRGYLDSTRPKLGPLGLTPTGWETSEYWYESHKLTPGFSYPPPN